MSAGSIKFVNVFKIIWDILFSLKKRLCMKTSCKHSSFAWDVRSSPPTFILLLFQIFTPTLQQFVCPPPNSPVKQTFWDVPLIIAFSDAQLPRGPAVTTDGTMVNKLSVKCKHSGVHVVCVSPTHAQISHRHACTQRPKHLAGQLKVHTQTLSHKRDSYSHTCAHGL